MAEMLGRSSLRGKRKYANGMCEDVNGKKVYVYFKRLGFGLDVGYKLFFPCASKNTLDHGCWFQQRGLCRQYSRSSIASPRSDWSAGDQLPLAT
jgi:hypothetical protein